jgi:hypothetical protein
MSLINDSRAFMKKGNVIDLSANCASAWCWGQPPAS